MRRIEPYEPHHAGQIVLNGVQQAELAGRDQASLIDAFAIGGASFTLRDKGGAILMIGGLLTIGPGYALAWAFLSVHSARHMRWITRKVRAYLMMAFPRWRRIEASARADFRPATRWLPMLGFAEEGLVQAALPDGADVLRFAQINKDWRAQA